MKTLSIFCLGLCIIGLSSQLVSAQAWLSGYNYRKKITIDKSRVKGNTNLLEFPFLISIVDTDLANLQQCDPKINSPGGLDISFCLASQPNVPIAFQLDSYDSASGRLTCWLRLEQLFAGNNAGTNLLYLYYGSNITSDPFEWPSTSVWTNDYDRLWHMNPDQSGQNLRSANGRAGKGAQGSSGIQYTNFVPGKIGTAVRFNGISDSFFSATDTNTTICITAWVKPKVIGKEQVIVSNDSVGGYQVSLDNAGYLVFDIISGSRKTSSVSSTPLTPGLWHHIALSYSKLQRKLFVNGLQQVGSTGVVSLVPGGRIRIGCSKAQDKWFEGEIDELRVQSVVRSNDWIYTEYLNQHEPALAYSISPEEKNPVNTTIAYEFTGQGGTQFWELGANWRYGKVPPSSANITVKANQVLRAGAAVQVNKLLMESGSMLYTGAEFTINCQATIATGAKIFLSPQSQLRLKGELMNHGSITGQGTIVLAGSQNLQILSGTGRIDLASLIVDLPNKAHIVLLQTDLQIRKYLKMIRGTFDANGRLSLLADEQNSASVWPNFDLANAALTGLVNVQQFIAGSFSAPATARGWRLLSAPVYHLNQSNQYSYQVKDIQKCVFVTGPAGTVNGFDPSVNNSSTIYTHNQALPGTLSQKYTGIPNIAAQIPFGRGIYLFSRGNRLMADAYARQIQGPVFVNPDAYLLQYTGFLFSGELTLNLENRNSSEPGDGFNLLGNPYAAPIVWSRLSKLNTGPFVWTFNPKNNAYQVSDDPNFIIPAGTGFFVRLNTGTTKGSLTFTEQAKYIEPTVSSVSGKIQFAENPIDRPTASRLHVEISKDALSDDYTLIYRSNGSNRVTDADALKIGSGYLGISSITQDGQRLAIEERAEIMNADTINLSIQVWAGGPCRLSFKDLNALNFSTILIDHELGLQREITAENNHYDFSLNADQVKSTEIERFSIVLKPGESTAMIKENENWKIYPNPFVDHVYIRSPSIGIKRPKVLIRNTMGKVVFMALTPSLTAGEAIEIDPGRLSNGIYMLSVFDQDRGKIIATYKLIKTTP